MLSVVKWYLCTSSHKENLSGCLWYLGNSRTQWGLWYYGSIKTWDKYLFFFYDTACLWYNKDGLHHRGQIHVNDVIMQHEFLFPTHKGRLQKETVIYIFFGILTSSSILCSRVKLPAEKLTSILNIQDNLSFGSCPFISSSELRVLKILFHLLLQELILTNYDCVY